MRLPDVDIDLPAGWHPERLFPEWTRASIVRDGLLIPHPCGTHPQRIPVDPLTGLSALPYATAEKAGFFKIDFLHLAVYDALKSRSQLIQLLQLEPRWSLLLDSSFQPRVFQLSKHADILEAVKPSSVETVADCLALIRPGKRQLLPLYLKVPAATRELLFKDSGDGYAFKKSHAIAYALVIKLQLLLEDSRVVT